MDFSLTLADCRLSNDHVVCRKVTFYTEKTKFFESIQFENAIVVPCLLIKTHLADGHFSDSSRLLSQPCPCRLVKSLLFILIRPNVFRSKDMDPTPIVAKLGVLV